MRSIQALAFAAVAAFTTTATAQVVPTVAGQQYLAIVGNNSSGGVCAGALCVGATQGVPFSFFAASDSVTSQFASLNSQLANEFTNMDAQLKQNLEYTSAVAALKDAIPMPGDRFALRINT